LLLGIKNNIKNRLLNQKEKLLRIVSLFGLKKYFYLKSLMIDKIKEIIPIDILKKIKSYLWLCRNCKEEFMNLENKWIYNKNFICLKCQIKKIN
jgi:hypothetical protein